MDNIVRTEYLGVQVGHKRDRRIDFIHIAPGLRYTQERFPNHTVSLGVMLIEWSSANLYDDDRSRYYNMINLGYYTNGLYDTNRLLGADGTSYTCTTFRALREIPPGNYPVDQWFIDRYRSMTGWGESSEGVEMLDWSAQMPAELSQVAEMTTHLITIRPPQIDGVGVESLSYFFLPDVKVGRVNMPLMGVAYVNISGWWSHVPFDPIFFARHPSHPHVHTDAGSMCWGGSKFLNNSTPDGIFGDFIGLWSGVGQVNNDDCMNYHEDTNLCRVCWEGTEYAEYERECQCGNSIRCINCAADCDNCGSEGWGCGSCSLNDYDPVLCENCRMYCDSCEATVSSSDATTCEHCGHTACDNCGEFDYCGDCSTAWCADCHSMEYCDSYNCREYYCGCERLLFNCEQCDDTYCDKCEMQVECDHCGKTICFDCANAHASLLFCPECFDKAVDYYVQLWLFGGSKWKTESGLNTLWPVWVSKRPIRSSKAATVRPLYFSRQRSKELGTTDDHPHP